ncbi:hypothetical protein LSCM1_05409 [Leishmania martiniquensis]|uniref:RRM domain-containing protein n=1 Tax=Leishmania martiniquensis TaxID=1580590 RepID=A0A836GQL4_9TRYP|nr:hypothetical protein LSCM1_05409 [Leishmania martiniquensis]
MAARLLEPTHPSVAGLAPNALIISGFPWYTSELAVHRYLTDVYPDAEPVTTRLYTNPTNGASRGHCFVEYNLPPSSAAASTFSSAELKATTGGSAVQGCSGGDGVVDSILPPVLCEVKRRVEEQPYECIYLKVHAYVLTSQRWSRAGRLPELPTDPPAAHWRGRTGIVVGYGDEGFSVRAGRELGLPNTVTPDGQVQLGRLRKRLRTASARRTAGYPSAE